MPIGFVTMCILYEIPKIARLMGPAWGPPGSCRPQVGPMNLAILDYVVMRPVLTIPRLQTLHKIDYFKHRFFGDEL